ncbi:MAG: SIS domain-containing protein [Nakamurella sp.]
MNYATGEIADQPNCWQQAASIAATDTVAAALPARGERVAIVGCGTSLYMAQACASLREATGQGETDAFPASEFPTGRRYDRLVAITRSGTTTEVLRVFDGLDADQRSTAITTGDRLPAASLSRSAVVLDFADEQSVVQTRFASTVLALWRVHRWESPTAPTADAKKVLARRLPSAYLEREQFTFLGTGWTVGIANEAALKVREASRSWAESYPAMEFRHGPISIIDHRSLVWIFGPAPPGLIEDLTGTDCAVVQSKIDPLASLIQAQRLAVAIAERKGLDPDAPRSLSRSIVLPAAGSLSR